MAALGHAYGPNAERGIFRTTDGGKTWQKVLYKDDNTGGIDVVFDPNNSNVLFASLWKLQRTPWSLNSGGPGSGLYKSTDGGDTWKHLEGHGLPERNPGPDRRFRLRRRFQSGVRADRGQGGGLYRSDNGGDNWTNVND